MFETIRGPSPGFKHKPDVKQFVYYKIPWYPKETELLL